MQKLAAPQRSMEFCCVSVLLGECAGVIYLIGTVTLKALNLW
jgi:hypothetical protein